jgi:hypothetical protein
MQRVPSEEPGEAPSKCECLPLHEYCDLATCSKARSSRTEVKSIGAEKGYVFYCECFWEDLVDSADAGCSTCHMVRQLVRQGLSAFQNFTAKDDREVFRRGVVEVGHYNGSLILSCFALMFIECRQSAPSSK